jgi:hypothetical protein
MALYVNDYEVEDMMRRFGEGETPNLLAGAYTLSLLMRWTDRNSDGWAYWALPKNAAMKLMTLLKAPDRFDPVDCTEAELRKAYTPIKAFLTRQNADHEDVFPTPPTPAFGEFMVTLLVEVNVTGLIEDDGEISIHAAVVNDTGDLITKDAGGLLPSQIEELASAEWPEWEIGN